MAKIENFFANFSITFFLKYLGIFIFMFLNLYFIKNYIKEASPSKVSGIFNSVLVPFILLVLSGFVEALYLIESFQSLMLSILIINITSHFIIEKSVKKRKKANELIFDIHYYRNDLMRAINYELENSNRGNLDIEKMKKLKGIISELRLKDVIDYSVQENK